ncbi:MAG: FtsX-like permease family protein [Bacteroidetes bacterium]|nr:FtsX-like permease family protein [Bacteroidota bacterium]
MALLIKIAWRNIWRNPSRSLTIILAVVVGLFAGIYASSISFGFVDQRFENSIERFISHIQLHNPDFVHDGEGFQLVANPGEKINWLDTSSAVKTFSVRTRVNGIVATAGVTNGAMIVGIDPAQEKATTRFDEWLKEGSYFEGVKRNPILIGSELAEKMHAGINSRIVLTFMDLEGNITSASFKVAGIFKTIDKPFDESNVFVLRSDLVKYLAVPEAVHEIAVLLKDPAQVKAVGDAMKLRWPETSARTWYEISPELQYLQEMTGQMLLVFIFIILLGLGFGILNTMLMSVFERTREIGMLMAIGMNKRRVFGLVLLETIFLSFTGAIGGMVTGVTLVKLSASKGIDFASVAGDSLADYGYGSLVYPSVSTGFVLGITAMVFVIAVLAAIYPALKALGLVPAEAVRKE